MFYIPVAVAVVAHEATTSRSALNVCMVPPLAPPLGESWLTALRLPAERAQFEAIPKGGVTHAPGGPWTYAKQPRAELAW